jgi:GNAT superfamily N-acetyltransferase
VTVTIEGPLSVPASAAERVLRTLPRWFGIEESLLEYAQAATELPTFAAMGPDGVVGFLSLKQHFEQAWEVHCVAVEATHRGHGVGRALQTRAERWLVAQGAKLLQVKTLADSHSSTEYAQTREFYKRLGYVALEVFPGLWASHLPVLQLVKVLEASDRADR